MVARADHDGRLGPALGPELTTGAPGVLHGPLATLFGLGPVLLAVFFLMIKEGAARLAFTWLFGLLGGTAFLHIAAWRLRRSRLQLHASGLRLRRLTGERVVPWDDVESLSLDETDLILNGVAKGVRRRLVLRAGGRTTKVWDVSNAARPEVGGLIETVVCRVCDSVERRLAAGAVLEGRRWSLDSSELRVGRERHPMDTLGRVVLLQDQVAVWAGAAEAALQAKADSPNARVLAELLRRRFARRGETFFAADPLGRLLFTSRQPRFVPGFTAGVGLIFVSNLPSMLAAGKWLDAAICAAIGGWLLRAFLPDLWSALRVHERGVSRRGLAGWRRMGFDEMDHLTYVNLRTTEKGYYTGTWVRFQFRAEGQRPMGFAYRTTRGGERDLEALRDLAAAQIARRLGARLGQSGGVAWTPVAVLTKQGVALASSPVNAVPYEQIRGWRVEGGELLVFGPDETTPLLRVPCSGEDFYPGLRILEARKAG